MSKRTEKEDPTSSSESSEEKPVVVSKNLALTKVAMSKRRRIEPKNSIFISPIYDINDSDDQKEDKKCVRNLMDSFNKLNVSTTVENLFKQKIFCHTNLPKHIQQIKDLLVFPSAENVENKSEKKSNNSTEESKKLVNNFVVTYFETNKNYFHGFPKNFNNIKKKQPKIKQEMECDRRTTRSSTSEVQFTFQSIKTDRRTKKQPEESNQGPTRMLRSNNQYILDPKSALVIHKNSFVYHPDHPAMWGLAFDPFRYPDNVFATCGAGIVSVYRCTDATNGGIKILFSHFDRNDEFYTCCWSYDINRPSHHYLITAGKLGVIRVIDPVLQKEIKTFQGHCGAVNDLKVSQLDPTLLLSASKDSSIRLWNLSTNVCVAIFGGVQGHRDEVLSVDFNLEKSVFASSSLDYSIKIWSLKSPEVAKATEDSRKFICDAAQRQFPTVSQHYPNFSTRAIHDNYIDCIQWFGDFIISKCCQEELVIWKPGNKTETIEDVMRRTHHSDTDSGTPDFVIIKKFKLNKSDVWFIKFAFDLNEEILAVGNLNGRLYIYDLKDFDPHKYRIAFDIPIPMAERINPNTIRQTAFNRDGTILIVLAESSYTIRYDLTRLNKTHIHTYLRMLADRETERMSPTKNE